MLNLSQRMTLQQKLTPQQVQYLQLLQLPVLALEQRIKAELEMNPLLEEALEPELAQDTEEPKLEENGEAAESDGESKEDGYTFEDFMNDDLDGHKATRAVADDEDREEPPQPAEVSLSQRLRDQILLLDLTPDDKLLCEEIIGNIDEDGYLRRDLQLIVEDLKL